MTTRFDPYSALDTRPHPLPPSERGVGLESARETDSARRASARVERRLGALVIVAGVGLAANAVATLHARPSLAPASPMVVCAASTNSAELAVERAVETPMPADAPSGPSCPSTAPQELVAALEKARVRPIRDDSDSAEDSESFEHWLERIEGSAAPRRKPAGKPSERTRRPLLVLVSSTDCGPCKDQAAAVGELARRFGTHVTVVGLLAEEAAQEALVVFRRAFANEGIPYAFWEDGRDALPEGAVPASLWRDADRTTSYCAGPIATRTPVGRALESWLVRQAPSPSPSGQVGALAPSMLRGTTR